MAVPIQPHAVLPSEADLRAFEAEFGFPLPDDYRAFLLQYNGGVFPAPPDVGGVPRHLAFRAEADPPFGDAGPLFAPGGLHDVALFHGLLRGEREYGDLGRIYPATRDWGHPDELLPVASALGNEKYFLCAAGPRRGQVLLAGDAFLDRRADGLPVTPADYHRLAHGFGEVLEGLAWGEPAP